jgi:hypothetical protein
MSFNEGIEAAATFLEETAEDYMQMREQLQKTKAMREHVADKIKAKECYEKAQLLQGQARQVRTLRKEN